MATKTLTETATSRAADTIRPTPTQAENDAFVLALINGTLPHVVTHAHDGSAVDEQSPDPAPKTPTWP